jgi:hypothetical protein
MRAFLDLHPDTCPPVTISAWINVESITDNQSQYVVSTGSRIQRPVSVPRDLQMRKNFLFLAGDSQ